MTTNEIWTLGIAAYAAVVSTFVLGWDAYKWLDSGPKLNVYASTEMRIIGGSADDAGKTFVSVTAANRGDRPTTITNLGLVYFKSRLWSIIRSNNPEQSFVISTPSQSQMLPYKLEAGGQWIGFAIQEESVNEMLRDGCLFAVVYHSHDGKGAKVRLRPKKLKTA